MNAGLKKKMKLSAVILDMTMLPHTIQKQSDIYKRGKTHIQYNL